MTPAGVHCDLHELPMSKRRPRSALVPQRAPDSRSATPPGIGWQIAALVALVLIAYLPLWRAGFIWDDDHMLTENPLIRARDGLYQFWCTRNAADYWPLTSTTLWAEWRLWGMHPLGYHLTNLALYLAEVLLLWSVLRRLRMPGAWLATVLFAVHPVNAESVTWIAQRKNLLAMLFYLLALLWFLKAAIVGRSAEGRRALEGPPPWRETQLHRGYYGLSLAAFVLAMLSKGSVAMLPIVLAGIVAWHRRPTFADLLRLAPYFLIAAVFAAVDVWFQGRGIPEVIRRAGFLERLLGAGGVVWFYLFKAIWPVHLVFFYPQWKIHPEKASWWLPLLAAIAFTLLLWRLARRESRRPRDEIRPGNLGRPYGRSALFAWGYFCVSLVPVLGFTDVYFMKYSLVADHYAHVALPGLAVWLGFAAQSLLRRSTGEIRFGLIALISLVIGLLASLTWRQNRMYRDGITLYRRVLEQDPNSWLGHNDLALELAKIPGALPDAIFHYEQAVRINPAYAPAHLNLAIALATIPERLPEALAHYEDALRIDPNYALAHDNFAIALAKIPGRLPEAVAQFEEALRIDPRDAQVHNHLAVALGKIPGRQLEAVAHFEKSLQLDRDDADTRYNFANLLTQIPGRLSDALVQYEQALRINPDFEEAHYNIAVTYARAGNVDQAIAHFERVLELDPANRGAREDLEKLRALK